MSFSQEIKNEMCRITLEHDNEKEACLLGMLMFLRQNGDNKAILFNTEHEETASLFEELIGEVVGSDIPVFTTTKTKNNKATVIQKRISDSDYVKKIYDYFINLADCDLTTVEGSYFDCSDEQSGAFMRGVFLVSGSITDPEKEYHIELSTSFDSLSDSISEMLNGLGFSFKISERVSKKIIYSKESEEIEDFLTFTGAVSSSLEIMNVKMIKQFKNKLNRISNCDYANYNKTLEASKKQVADIKYVMEHLSQTDLSEQMIEIAELKLEDPETSLRELAEMLSDPISRSGVNHRLQKFSKIATDLREKNGDAYKGDKTDG